MPDRRYWDDTAFLAALADTRSAAADALRAADVGGVLINTSALTLLRLFEAAPDAYTHRIYDYMRRHYLNLIEVERTAAESAREYAVEYLISIESALHLWSAVRSGVTLMETEREDLLALDGRVPTAGAFKIRRPEVAWPDAGPPGPLTLFDVAAPDTALPDNAPRQIAPPTDEAGSEAEPSPAPEADAKEAAVIDKGASGAAKATPQTSAFTASIEPSAASGSATPAAATPPKPAPGGQPPKS